MKKIEAIIKPFKLDEVKDALCSAGFTGLTLLEARGLGRQLGQTEVFRTTGDPVELIAKVKIELVVADGNAERAVAIILKAAQTGKIGDGKIFVSAIDKAIRIRTGEQGEAAV